MLASIASTFSSPLVHSLAFFAIFKLLSHTKFKPTLFNYLSIVPLLWLLICSMTYPSVLLIKPLEDQYPVIPLSSQQWRKTEAIVVLACNYFEDNKLPFVSRWPNCSLQRNLHAALMYREHPMPIFLAGNILGSNDKYSQASHNKYFFEQMGVNSADILIIPKGINTESEVHALMSILDGKYISLVTSASHLPRAVFYFEENNLKVLPIPVEHFSNKRVEPVAGLPNAASLYRSEGAIHEYLGLIYQRYVR
ncbi:MAG: YdcF family protein [Paraglaciecola sp.]|nr:YdcF family protein [Paraglaciecola sp.]